MHPTFSFLSPPWKSVDRTDWVWLYIEVMREVKRNKQGNRDKPKAGSVTNLALRGGLLRFYCECLNSPNVLMFESECPFVWMIKSIQWIVPMLQHQYMRLRKLGDAVPNTGTFTFHPQQLECQDYLCSDYISGIIRISATGPDGERQLWVLVSWRKQNGGMKSIQFLYMTSDAKMAAFIKSRKIILKQLPKWEIDHHFENRLFFKNG